MLVCRYCSRELSRPAGLAIHEKACKQNPNRIPGKNGYSYGYKPSEETRQRWREAMERRDPPSLETRRKISESRIQYLKEHPDKVPYKLNHYSKGESYPEQYWRQILTDANIEFEQEKSVSIYRLDFAIGSIDLEIDGEQHYVDPRILASNQRRDEELRKLGWKVLRVRWADFQRMSTRSRQEYVNFILLEIRHL